MKGLSNRSNDRADEMYSHLVDAINEDRRDFASLRAEVQREVGRIEKKLDAVVAQLNEKRELERIAAISDVVKNDKSYKVIAVVTTALSLVAIIFAVLLALFWKK